MITGKRKRRRGVALREVCSRENLDHLRDVVVECECVCCVSM